jgi:hypothetical protein
LWRSGKIRRWGDDGEHVMRDAGSVVMKAPGAPPPYRRSHITPFYGFGRERLPVPDRGPLGRLSSSHDQRGDMTEGRRVIYTAQALEAVELVRAADRLCPYSDATRGNVEVSLTVNGRDVEATSAPVVA